jgi:hypothetical protein
MDEAKRKQSGHWLTLQSAGSSSTWGCRIDPGQAARMRQAAHAHVREQYVGDLHLLRYGGCLAR